MILPGYSPNVIQVKVSKLSSVCRLPAFSPVLGKINGLEIYWVKVLTFGSSKFSFEKQLNCFHGKAHKSLNVFTFYGFRH